MSHCSIHSLFRFSIFLSFTCFLFLWRVFTSRTYTRENKRMWESPTFEKGITNGADWYECITYSVTHWAQVSSLWRNARCALSHLSLTLNLIIVELLACRMHGNNSRGILHLLFSPCSYFRSRVTNGPHQPTWRHYGKIIGSLSSNS